MRIAAQRAYALWWKDLKRWMVPGDSAIRRVLPEGWTIVRVGDVVRQVSERVKVGPDEEYKMLGVKWYGEGTFYRETVKGDAISAAYLTPVVTNAFIYNRLFAWKQSFAVVPEEHGDCFVSNEFPQFIVDEKRLLPRYLYLFFMLKTTTEAVKASSVGSAAVSRNRFKEVEFLDFEMPLPPLEEQCAVITRWKDVQEEAKSLADWVNQLEADIDTHFFIDLGVIAKKHVDRPKYLAVLWKDLARWSVRSAIDYMLGLNELPAVQFKYISLGDIAEVSYGIQKSPVNRPAQHPRPYLRVANVRKGYLDLSEVKTINVPDGEMKTFRLEAGDILFVEGNGSRAELGRVAIWNDEIQDCVHQNHLIKVRINQTQLLPEFAMTWFNTGIGRSHFFRAAKTSSGLGTINSAEVRSAPIPLPPLDVQRDIMRRVKEGQAEIDRLQEAARRREREAEEEIEALILGLKKVEALS